MGKLVSKHQGRASDWFNSHEFRDRAIKDKWIFLQIRKFNILALVRQVLEGEYGSRIGKSITVHFLPEIS